MTNPSSLTNEPGTDPAPFGTSGIYTQTLTTLFEYSIWARDRHLPLIQDLEKKKEAKGSTDRTAKGSVRLYPRHVGSYGAVAMAVGYSAAHGEYSTGLPKGEDFVDLTAIINW